MAVLKNLFRGCGVVKGSKSYTIALFSTDDSFMGSGELVSMLNYPEGGFELRTKEDLVIEHTGDFGYAVIKENGKARWLLPWENVNLSPLEQTLYQGNLLSLTHLRTT